MLKIYQKHALDLGILTFRYTRIRSAPAYKVFDTGIVPVCNVFNPILVGGG